MGKKVGFGIGELKAYKVDGRPAPAMGETAWPFRCLPPQTWSVRDFVWTDLQTLRLAIATWEKGASWRAQGWAGENGDRSDRALHSSQVAVGDHPTLCGVKNKKPFLKIGEGEESWDCCSG
jgi:hypothetical protein